MIKRSLNRQLMVAFSSILILVVISNIVINSLLLPKVYRDKKIRSMEALYHNINRQYEQTGDRDVIAEIVKDVLSVENLRVFIWDEEDNLVIDSLPLSIEKDAAGEQSAADVPHREFMGDKTPPDNGFPGNDKKNYAKSFNGRRNEIFVFFADVDQEQIICENDDYLMFASSFVDNKDEENFYLRGYLANGYKILIQMPFSSIEEAVSLSDTLLLIVGLAMLFIGIVVVAVISKTIAKPIKELSSIASAMENLDFSRQYVHNRRDEIGSLGDSINSLSGKLEHTINELFEKNEELRKDNELKSRIDTLRKEFIANASHELKTPVALISGYAEGLRDNIASDDNTRRVYTDVIIEEADKMDHIIRQMLDLMEIDGTDEVIDGTEFSLFSLAEECINSFDLLIKSKNINLKLETDGNCFVFGDYWRIYQAASNYISNAINHVNDDKIIKIFVRETSDGVLFSVYNSGAQIPCEDMENIWERFYKIDKAHTREYGGTGLGLSVVRSVIELHNGEYGAVNKPDGVEFYFKLNKA